MKYQIYLTHIAQQDILDIFTYITYELCDRERTEKQVLNIEKAIYSLERMPERCSLIDFENFAFYGVRKLIADNYLIFYKITESSLTILRVLYAKRDWLSLL